MISKPGQMEGKQVWIDILKKQYSSAFEAAEMYGLSATQWDDFADVTRAKTVRLPSSVSL